MPIVNVPIDVPVDLAVRIAAGELYRDGSVVRHVISKRIVKHLSEVDRDATAKAASKMLAAAKANPLAAGVTAAVAVVSVGAVAATTALVARKRSTSATIERFEAALRSYLEETGQGRISTDVIDELDSAWSAAKALPNGASHSLQASPVFGQATQVIAGFTFDFAKANNADVSDLVAAGDTGTDLSEYLEVQRRILDAA
ncbi:hypothetical protein [Dietzia sp. Alg238-R159]|nr:hypothetical protein [Dietzia sp. Alg238-R159]